MQTKWTWCCCGCPKCSACAGNEGPEMIWTHVRGMAAACDSHNRNLEFDYYGRYQGGCAYGVEGEDPHTDNLIGIYPDGYATFRSIGVSQPTANYRYPDCSGGVLNPMDCVQWGDENSAWTCCEETCDCTNAYIEVLGVGPRQILDNDEGPILDQDGTPIVGIIESECGQEPLPTFTCPGCLQDTAPAQMKIIVQGIQFKDHFDDDGIYCINTNGTWIANIVQDSVFPQACEYRVTIPSPDPGTVNDGWIQLLIDYDQIVPGEVRYNARVVAPSELFSPRASDFWFTQVTGTKPDCTLIEDRVLSPVADAPTVQCEIQTATVEISAILA